MSQFRCVPACADLSRVHCKKRNGLHARARRDKREGRGRHRSECCCHRSLQTASVRCLTPSSVPYLGCEEESYKHICWEALTLVIESFYDRVAYTILIDCGMSPWNVGTEEVSHSRQHTMVYSQIIIFMTLQPCVPSARESPASRTCSSCSAPATRALRACSSNRLPSKPPQHHSV